MYNGFTIKVKVMLLEEGDLECSGDLLLKR